MCRRFVSRVGTSVAGGTNSGGLIMREWHNKHCPYISGMARFTEFRGLRMCRGFIRSGTDAIMTPRAVTRLPGHRAVIKQNLQPIGGVVTHIASLGGGDMRGTFTGGDSAVMTVFTQVSGLAVFKRYYVRLPSGAGSMTGFALIRC